MSAEEKPKRARRAKQPKPAGPSPAEKFFLFSWNWISGKGRISLAEQAQAEAAAAEQAQADADALASVLPALEIAADQDLNAEVPQKPAEAVHESAEEEAEDDAGDDETPAEPGAKPRPKPAPKIVLSDVARAHLKGVLEALVFASDHPLELKELVRLSKAERSVVKPLMQELVADYRDRGFRLDEVAGGFVFRTSPVFAPFVREMGEKKPIKMTRAQIETLAIVAYRQPITRPEIDDVRGVDSGAVLKSLLERDLVRILGKKEEPGRPMLYGTTAQFLEFFGLKALSELPTLREFTELSDESKRAYEREMGEEPPDHFEPSNQAFVDSGLAGGEGDFRPPGAPVDTGVQEAAAVEQDKVVFEDSVQAELKEKDAMSKQESFEEEEERNKIHAHAEEPDEDEDEDDDDDDDEDEDEDDDDDEDDDEDLDDDDDDEDDDFDDDDDDDEDEDDEDDDDDDDWDDEDEDDEDEDDEDEDDDDA